MLSPDLIYNFSLKLLESNHFGRDILTKPTFIEYLKDFSIFVTFAEKKIEDIRINSAYYRNNLVALEIYRVTLIRDRRVWTTGDNTYNLYFSAEAIECYLQLYDIVSNNEHWIKYKQTLSFVLSNSDAKTQLDIRIELLNLLNRREEKFKRFIENRKRIPINRVAVLMEFHDPEEFIRWLSANGISNLKIDNDYVMFNKLPKPDKKK